MMTQKYSERFFYELLPKSGRGDRKRDTFSPRAERHVKTFN